MCTRFGKTRFGKACGVLVVLATLSALAFAFRPAGAQGGSHLPVTPPDPIGPILLQNGDHAIIGVLLPAVQRMRHDAMLVILDSSGSPIARVSLPAVQNQPYTTAFVDVYMGDGSVRIVRRGGDPAAGALFDGPSDGTLIGLLLPAVQRNGNAVYPTSATMQVMDSSGGTRFALPFRPPNPNLEREKDPGPQQ